MDHTRTTVMHMTLIDIFKGICPPLDGPSNKPLYAVMAIPGHSGYFVGKDKKSLACLLVSTSDQAGKPHPPIRLESLDAQFELRCHLKNVDEPEREGTFTVIRCRDSDIETIRYFLSVCNTLLNILGSQPTRTSIATAVNRLAAIFQKVRLPPARSLNGLFGELYLLLRSRSAVAALSSWRINERSRFDFSSDEVRLEVKASSGRNRVHTFSYEQCSPPSGTVAVVASLYAEQTASGSSLYTIINQIESRVSAHTDLVFKLHETVATTLGANLSDALPRRFDMHLAESSLRFFNMDDVPAIRGTLPAGVSDVHFRSDLSALLPVSMEELINRNPTFEDILPSEGVPT